MDLDRRGIPGGFIASTEFVQAAEAQAKSLGFEASSVFVPHPIQDRSDDEMRVLADEAYQAVLGLVLASESES
ncbi:MAG: hypothetical protein KDI36_08740 [Pseudomonadales bacterium]|nr:hypothetical protein [Pseudomonadales bacterium]